MPRRSPQRSPATGVVVNTQTLVTTVVGVGVLAIVGLIWDDVENSSVKKWAQQEFAQASKADDARQQTFEAYRAERHERDLDDTRWKTETEGRIKGLEKEVKKGNRGIEELLERTSPDNEPQ